LQSFHKKAVQILRRLAALAFQPIIYSRRYLAARKYFDMKKIWLAGFIVVVALFSCKEKYKNPHIIIESFYGDIEVELFPDKAPKSVAAFLSYIDSGFYKNSSFYRILSVDNQPMGTGAAELIQGGLYRSQNRHDNLPGIPHETTQQTGLQHKSGTISLARMEPGTATTEFFICIGDQPGFDYGGQNNADGQGYAAFGTVVKGMDAVNKIYGRPEENQSFNPPVGISDIRRY
jgi:peptidyl-prolyl cis-trans isomerase A (cyclophilin A)